MDDLLPVALPFSEGAGPANESGSEEFHDRAPATAEEYLKRVRYQSLMCLEIVHFAIYMCRSHVFRIV